jgi:hypothetical protein
LATFWITWRGWLLIQGKDSHFLLELSNFRPRFHQRLAKSVWQHWWFFWSSLQSLQLNTWRGWNSGLGRTVDSELLQLSCSLGILLLDSPLSHSDQKFHKLNSEIIHIKQTKFSRSVWLKFWDQSIHIQYLCFYLGSMGYSPVSDNIVDKQIQKSIKYRSSCS